MPAEGFLLPIEAVLLIFGLGGLSGFGFAALLLAAGGVRR